MVSGISRQPCRYPNTSFMAMGWQGVPTHRGVIITGSRSTRYLSISKEALPDPRIMAARRQVAGTPLSRRISSCFVPGAQMFAQVRVIRIAQPPKVDDPLDALERRGRRHVQCRPAVGIGKPVPAGDHGMDQVINGAAAGDGLLDGSQV